MFSGLLKMLPTFRKDNVKDTESPLNYDDLISLDAETLAEEGIAGAYQRLLPELKKHIRNPAQIYEYIDSEIPEYKVSCNGEEFTIYSAEVPGSEEESWARATYSLFVIVNAQLCDSEITFFAIDADNNLSGMFLTEQEAMAARNIIKSEADWPYIPTLDAPFYGQYHEGKSAGCMSQ
ncbi:hypothetical protein HV318_08305 [Enterobacter sp. RHBSTW-00901]|jgi:hypothetical protein|uniref:hypothetical protein n=1 Tax=Enterobacter sp. RHBSTW-00901 TaxID=2742669 RepID=UPI0015F5AA3C|nr:hypothetical protein [Enterobacter sp. RHBSTW-00901]MBA7855025.1 hypothetical protein [Enterobacter sp. RHBSTW-00901]